MKKSDKNAENTKKVLDIVDFLMWYLLVIPFVFLPMFVATIIYATVDEIIYYYGGEFRSPRSKNN